MVAVPLIHGRLTAPDYEDDIAFDSRIDALRAKMRCVEDPAFTEAYHDPTRRSIPNGITVRFTDGTSLPEVVVEYPIGHRRRRAEAIPLLREKFARNLRRIFSPAQCAAIEEVSRSVPELDAMLVSDYVNLYVPSTK
jgi:2-methylcitrate dehydratase